MSQLAPDFTLKDQHGDNQTLSDYRGQWVVVYFYPKDDTPGCTKEACSFRDANSVFANKKIKVFGISADTVASHKKFDDKFGLGFTLLSDRDKAVITAFGAVGEKSMFGKTYMGILRNTYLINAAGEITKVYENVKPQDHALQILKDAEALA